jgi:transcriptional regulator with XRE-family HTH domain
MIPDHSDNVPMMPRIPSIDLRTILAENVKAFRGKHCYSQEGLADSCGLHRTYIGAIERGERNVSLSTLEVLALALDVSVPELLTQGSIDASKTPVRL